jgi:carboxynorspermidine decarboxylase
MGTLRDPRPPFHGLGGQNPSEMFDSLPTPCYILDEAALRRNGEILAGVAKRTGCRVLLAQKAFSNYDLYPVLAPYLAGTEASGLYEARLGAKKMPGKEVHVFCGAYRDDEFDELLLYADHIVFNSPRQLEKFGAAAKAAGKSVGLRVNPECSTQEGHAIYDPCSPGSRLGTTRAQWDEKMTPELTSLLDGLHFHTLCEQDSDALETTLHAIDEKFGDILPDLGWLNFGGGHHITRPDYDIPRLERCIAFAQEKWNVQVYLEPGEACALNAGYFATRVLDVLKNGSTDLAILDASAACHMPDVIEMPYRPPLYGAGDPEDQNEQSSADVASTKSKASAAKPYMYRLGGPTCLAGDVVGDYTFDHPLTEGELLLFGDMAIYTTCKNNTFNGMPLPAIYVRHADGTLECLKSFHYDDFRCRLGR